MARLRTRKAEMEKWYIRALPVALGVGALGLAGGLIINALLATSGRGDIRVAAFFAAGAFVATYVVLAIVEFSGGVAARMYGGSPFTPPPPDFSYADSLAIRGLHEAAVAAYRNDAEEHPDTPEPLLRAARVLRDALQRYPEAIEVFRAVRSHPAADEGLEAIVTREIAEIHINRVGEPARALPELARLVERYPDSQAAEWARRRMAELKAELWETVKDQSQ